MKIKKDVLKYFILIMPFLEPLLFKEIGYERIDDIYSVFKIASFLYVCLLYVERRKYSSLTLNIIALEALTLFSTLVSSGDIVRFFGPCVSILGMVMLTEYYLPKLKLTFYKVNYVILYIQMVINLITVILFPDGILRTIGGNRVYFLGIGNRFVFTLIPLIFTAIVYSFKKYNKINSIAMSTIALALYSTISQWSVGGTLGLLLIALSIIIFSKFDFIKKININKFVLIMIVLNILVVFVQIQNYFADFIVNVLKKDITLTGRTIIWGNAIELVKKNPLIGFGIQPLSVLTPIYYGVGHTHNMLLSYLTTVGIIGTCIFFNIYNILSKNTSKMKNLKIKGLFSITIFVILFLSIADSLDSGIFFMLYMCIFKHEGVFCDEEKDRDINI